MRRAVLAVLVLLIGPLLLGGCVVVQPDRSPTATGPAPEAPPDDTDGVPAEQRIARAIFDRVNDEREARGVEPVAWNEALATVAREWSAEMADTGQFEHQDVREVLERDELSGFVGLGENIFQATGPVPAGAIHAGWMRSDGHRVNVVNPGWNRLGIGVVCRDGRVWATQQFGRTVDADRPPVSEEVPPQEPIARPEEDGPACA